jgi:hypothetical protein
LLERSTCRLHTRCRGAQIGFRYQRPFRVGVIGLRLSQGRLCLRCARHRRRAGALRLGCLRRRVSRPAHGGVGRKLGFAGSRFRFRHRFA